MPYDLHEDGVLDPFDERPGRFTCVERCRVQHAHLYQLASIECFIGGTNGRIGNPVLPDMYQGLERMGERTKVGPLF